MYIIENLHNKIKKAAAHKNIALKILAINMDMTEQGLYNILKRDNMPLDKFLNMAKGLDMKPDELLKYIITDTSANALQNDDNMQTAQVNGNYENLLQQVIITNKIIVDILTHKTI